MSRKLARVALVFGAVVAALGPSPVAMIRGPLAPLRRLGTWATSPISPRPRQSERLGDAR
jgi:hypothetical protein